jgi:hypothetical protein
LPSLDLHVRKRHRIVHQFLDSRLLERRGVGQADVAAHLAGAF